ncbi:adenylate kinase [Mycoplasma testudineum]|uniref:Adenylate kinase n=1 Tax=Mycoplasma testudineum TaxID=244584 RepID=A0A4R6IG13_9MOLU|nr:nucleoside monophosphate kinase [Mycoplasma testudineum]OYD27161.1 adenylate kinase [Mycoplasma testudineum]TDO21082.1 adenylate kinase [Mycoplasma testudineum]
MIKKIIIFGPPGVGKGTLAKEIEKQFHYEHISTGNIFREEIKKESDLGIKLKQIVESGAYVQDSITNEIVKNKLTELNENNSAFILDGYPRTSSQVEYLFSIDNPKDYQVWNLNAAEEVILQRLSGRRDCLLCKRQYHVSFKKPKVAEKCDFDNSTLNQRADDKPEAIKKRLDIYARETESLIKLLNQKTTVIDIDANSNPETVFQDTIKKVNFGN